ncbi:MAG TPA: hypothetical protein VF349_03265, partial [Candidatus Limnocylindrales bacterium]
MTFEPSDESGAGGTSSGVSLSPPGDSWGRLRTGVWRVAVAEESMAPALAAGDWLLLDPTPARWPRRG